MKKIYLLLPVFLVGMVLVGAGCDVVSNESYKQESEALQNSQNKMLVSVPIPVIQNSAERANIAARAKLFDVQNKTSYIYLVSYGKVMAFFPVKGKVSSLRSYLTPQEKLVYGGGQSCSSGSSGSCYTVSAPDIDGSYGTNTDGVFFFTTEGAYVEWKGDYMMSDQPLKLTTQPELVREIK